MNRIRRDSEETPAGELSSEDPSIHGIGSLISGHPDGISLDGESVVLPSEFDEMSFNTFAIESKNTGNFRLNGSGDDSTVGEPPFLSLPQKNKKEIGDSEGGRIGCIPSWLIDAPSWLKLAIIVSSALLVGACVLLTVAAALNSTENDISKSSSFTNPNSDSIQFPEDNSATFRPTTQSSASPTTLGSITLHSSTPTSLRPISHPSSDSNITNGPNHLGETFQPSASPSTFPSIIPSFASTSNPSYDQTTVPVNSPSDTPTNLPSVMPSVLDSLLPSLELSLSPSDDQPSLSPSDGYSDLPSNGPSMLPSSKPSKMVTASPITGSKTVFYLTAGRPVNNDLTLFEDNLGRLPKSSDFMINLGDFNQPLITGCDEESYQKITLLYARSTVPVYFIPGDNEYNDCPNPDQAMDFWKKNLLNFERVHWPSPRWEVNRDEIPYDPNFSFVLRRVLYIGINLVGGKQHDEKEWYDRQQANLKWIDSRFRAYRREFDVMILFTHADPNISTNDNFFKPFFQSVRRTYNVPTVLIHRNLGMEGSGLEQNFDGIQDLVVLVVKGDTWPPMKVEIDTRTGSFSWDQGNWFQYGNDD